MKHLITTNGRPSATKTMLAVFGALVMIRWLIGGLTLGQYEFSYVSGTEVAAIYAALAGSYWGSKRIDEQKAPPQ